MIPIEIREALELYVDQRIETGGFLRAVLENNLKEACARADHINRHLLFEIVSYLYNDVPMACWGNSEKVAVWLSE